MTALLAALRTVLEPSLGERLADERARNIATAAAYSGDPASVIAERGLARNIPELAFELARGLDLSESERLALIDDVADVITDSGVLDEGASA